MSRVAWILPDLKKKFGGNFYITPAVKKELVDRPLLVHRFQFEALQVLKMIREGVLEVYDKVPQQRVNALRTLANSSFFVDKQPMEIMQSGEMESVAAAVDNKAAVVMDERTLRLFIENSSEMKKLLEMRFQKNITANTKNIQEFSRQLKGVTIIRSIELVGVAYKLGLLNSYLPPQKDGKSLLLDSVLWATKYNGCAVTEHEIEEIKEFLLKK